jgi:hypothetical protein
VDLGSLFPYASCVMRDVMHAEAARAPWLKVYPFDSESAFNDQLGVPLVKGTAGDTWRD